MKKITKIVAAMAAGTTLLAPMLSQAAVEIKSVEYNSEITTSSGALKLGYTESTDSTDTWWKTETVYTDWEETDEAGYNAITEEDLRDKDDTDRSDWKDAGYDKYVQYYNLGGDDLARLNGYTAFADASKEKYDAASEECRQIIYSNVWTSTDEAGYNAADEDCRRTYKSDWVQFADDTNWEEKYNEWITYSEDNRSANGDLTGTWKKVDLVTYNSFAAKFPGYDNKIFKYEDLEVSDTSFTNWPYFDYQIICENYYACNGHDPYFVLCSSFTRGANYGGCEGGTWDNKDDGLIYFNASNGASALNVAESTIAYLDEKGIEYTEVYSKADFYDQYGNIKISGATKKTQHASDGIHNAGPDDGNGFIDIVDSDFKIYYYAGYDDLEVQELYGILIAPHATVIAGGKWVGTIIAQNVTAAGNWFESTKWTLPNNKGTTTRNYYITDPQLLVRSDVYETTTKTYQTREQKYQVRDIVTHYYKRSTEEVKYYAKVKPYVPATGDMATIYVIIGVAVVLVAGVVLIIVSSRKKR